jgi:hypothetical protein
MSVRRPLGDEMRTTHAQPLPPAKVIPNMHRVCQQPNIPRVRRLSRHQHKVTPVKISAIFTEDITVTHVHQGHINEQLAETPAKQINAKLTEIKFDRSRYLSLFATTSGLIVEAAGRWAGEARSTTARPSSSV